MKSCIEWRKGFKYLPQIDEFNIDFRNKEIKLLEFLDTYAKSQRVNIRLSENYTQDDIDLLIAIYEKGIYNIVLLLPDYYYAKTLKDKNIPFYFTTPALSWDQLEGFLSLGVSDVFISGELGFDLERVRFITNQNHIQTRCYVNIAQSSAWNNGSGFKDFFIRPEDIDIYNDYIDVIEFYESVDKQNVLYEIYFKDKEWNGKLREIIQGLKSDINNYYILGSEFGRRRTTCGKKCIKGERCQLCDKLNELADTLEDSKEYEVYKRR